MTQIQIDWSRTVETARHNLATEKQAVAELNETHRHNVVGENETIRHNKVGENETHRHNVKTENESIRHNKVTENETKRHNKKTESQEDKRIKETKRHNKKTEKQEDKRIGETKRHNKTSEAQESAKIQIQRDKATSEIANIDAKTVALELANAADKSDPALYKANRFINVFKSNAPAAWIYYGLENLTQKDKATINKETSKVNPNNNKIISIIEKTKKFTSGEGLSKTDRDNLERFFNFGSGSGWRTNYEVEHDIVKPKKSKTSKTHTSSSRSTHGGGGGKF